MSTSESAPSVRNDAHERRADRMTPPGSVPSRRTLAPDELLLRRLLAELGDPPVDFLLPDGRRVRGRAADSVATLRLANRRTLLRLLWHPSFEFAEAYCDGRIAVEGDLVGFIEATSRALRAAPTGSVSGLRQRLQQLRRNASNTQRRARDNVQHHYDLGNDFYALWLGPTMAYTCAYYPTPDASLDQAQIAKMELICRKLRLRPGESVVEAGCGWGSLALYMARRCGVRVRAYNISREQIAWAREAAQRQGLAGRVEFVEEDYRGITGRFDAFVSVGMLEHVGPDHYRELGRIARDAIGEGGRGLLHSIGRNRPRPFDAWTATRIFPGAYPPALREMLEIFEPWDLSVLDVENLRLHYAQTLRHWLAAFTAAESRVERMFDRRFVRMWRLYLAGSTAAFTTGSLQLFQVVFAPGGSNAMPMTRTGIYRDRMAADD